MSGGGVREYARPTAERADQAGRQAPEFPVPRNWSRVDRRKVRRIRDQLRAHFGEKPNDPHGDPIHELVLTILSQNTNDNNRDRAYISLRETLGGWETIRTAPTRDVIEAIRPGGLANQKGPRIQEVLDRLGPDPSLDWLRDAPREVAIDFLTSLPGVGRKTAACVMIFSFDRPEIPVDTHVHRVGGRLGLFRPNAPFDEAHDEMLAITDPGDAYELHMNLIELGRGPCRPRPRCGECPVSRSCVAKREGLVEPIG